MWLKIFRNSFIIGLAVLVLCLALFFSVLYSYYENKVYDELAVEAGYVAAGIGNAGEAYLRSLSSETRITWVDEDGDVLYDTAADASTMDNHLDREEIAQALESGAGRGKHYSDTLLQKTMYYAQRLPDGTVIRVATTHNSAAAMLIGMLQPILWIILLVLLLSALLSSRLARQITKPINALDLDDPGKDIPYPELDPLINRVRTQNRTIRRQMDELSKKQREFAAISENMSEGFLLIDNRRQILSANQSGLDAVCGRSGSEAKAISRVNCREEFCRAVDIALAGVRTEQILESEGRSLQLIVSPVAADSQVTGAVLIIIDVTEREQRERLRREFSANVSHELKTPLTSISGFAELMKEGLVPADKVREFSEDIYKESRRLLTLVEDILRLSKMDENAEIFQRETVDLFRLCQEVLHDLRPAAEKKQVSMELEGKSLFIPGYRQILNEMVYNLCDNAIKYNRPGGSVTLKLQRSGREVRLDVTDTGIGIPAAHQSRVFERFYCVDKSHSKAVGGTGLGLSIVRHGAQYHNGRVELKSEPGVGSTFTLVFPAEGEA